MNKNRIIIFSSVLFLIVGCGKQPDYTPEEVTVESENDISTDSNVTDTETNRVELEEVQEVGAEIALAEKEYYIDINVLQESDISFVDNGTKILGMNLLPFTKIDNESNKINTGSQIKIKTFDEEDTMAYITVESSKEGISRLNNLKEEFAAYAESREAYNIVSGYSAFIIPADEIKTSVGTLQMYAVKEDYSQPTFEKRGYIVGEGFAVEIIFMDYEKISNATYKISFNDFATGVFDMDYKFDLIYKASNATEEAMADWEKYQSSFDSMEQVSEDTETSTKEVENNSEQASQGSEDTNNDIESSTLIQLYSYTDCYGDTYTLSATNDKPTPGTTIIWSGHAFDAYNSITAQDGKGWINYDPQVNNIDQYTLTDELCKNGTVIWMNAWEQGFDVCLYWNTDGTILVNPSR